METAYIQSPLGITKIEGDENGLAVIQVLNTDETITPVIPEVLEDAVYQLHEYFEGKRKNFDIDLNPTKTHSYLQLSKILGDPKAIRAVASANGKNPLWIVVPCHRVIGSDGSLTGYAGGLHRKKWLLDHESPAKQQSLF